MKLSSLHIHGFGKFHQKTWTFQDGIHVIYGLNEAGKSTLHTFLGCMLFGLERGRGRAARTDRYSRYLPWDHDGTYGGSLTFEKEDGIYRIQRSFRSDHRSCLLSTPHQAPMACTDEQKLQELYEGLTEPLYYNTISVHGLGCAPDANLAQELSRQLHQLQHSGSQAIDSHAALQWLKAQRKQYESLLTPNLESQILTKQQTLLQMREQLQHTDFLEQKLQLEQQMEDCLTQLSCHTPSPGKEMWDPSSPSEDPSRSAIQRRPRWGLLFLALILAATFFLLWQKEPSQMAYGLGGASCLCVLLGLLFPKSIPYPDQEAAEDENWPEDYETGCHEEDHAPDYGDSSDDPTTHRIRLHLQSLQAKYQSVCHQEWDYHRLDEQAQVCEEELQQLLHKEEAEQQIRMEIQAISLAASTLQQLSSHMQNHIGPRLADAMSQILSSLTDGSYSQVYLDGQLHIQVQAGAHVVPLESLSRGTMEQVYLSMRLALIDLLFPQGGMPLLLDDCFLSYDDQRLTQTLLWLAEHYSGQVFLFTCQKREAALLQQCQIPFTHILLS